MKKTKNQYRTNLIGQELARQNKIATLVLISLLIVSLLLFLKHNLDLADTTDFCCNLSLFNLIKNLFVLLTILALYNKVLLIVIYNYGYYRWKNSLPVKVVSDKVLAKRKFKGVKKIKVIRHLLIPLNWLLYIFGSFIFSVSEGHQTLCCPGEYTRFGTDCISNGSFFALIAIFILSIIIIILKIYYYYQRNLWLKNKNI